MYRVRIRLRPSPWGRLFFACVLAGAVIWGRNAWSNQNPSLTWLWANPQPHGNEIYDLAVANGLAIEAGDCGQLYTSLDYDLWIPRDSHTTNALRAVTFFGSSVIVTGQAGTVLYADVSSLTNFTRLDLGTSDWLESVAASPNLVVAVGDNGAIYTSTTGTNWTRRPQSFSNWLSGVAYGGNTFVAVGAGGLIVTSADGATWTRAAQVTANDLNRVVWLTNRFAAVGNAGTVLVSVGTLARNWQQVVAANAPTNDLYAVTGTRVNLSDMLVVAGVEELRRLTLGASSWQNELDTNKTLPAPAWTYYSGVWDGALFLMGGHTGMLVEGFTPTNAPGTYVWETPGNSLRHWLWDVAELPGLYVAVGDFGTVETSDTGADWTFELVPSAVTSEVLLGVGGTTNGLLAVGSQGTMIFSPNVITNFVSTNLDGTLTTNHASTLGVIWNQVQPSPTTNDLQGVLVWRGRYVVSGGAGTVLSSTDGQTWTRSSAPTTSFLSGLAEYPGGLVSVGENGAIFTSSDATNWTSVSLSTTNWLYRVRYLGGQLVVVGENGSILTSPDGLAWAARSSGTTSWLTDCAFFKGTYYAVGSQGTVLASATGADWSSVGTLTKYALYAAIADAHQLVTAGVEGVILRAQGGPLDFLSYSRPQGTNSFLISGRPGAQFDLQGSPSFTGWTSLRTLQFLDNTGQLIESEATTNAPNAFFFRAAGP